MVAINFQKRIAALENMAGWSIQVAALTEMLGLTRSTYNSLTVAAALRGAGRPLPVMRRD